MTEAETERARIRSILSLDEARGREAAALGLALDTELTVDAAKSILSGLPKSAPVAQSGRATHSPIGLVLAGGDQPKNDLYAAHTPGELAAVINKETGAPRRE